MRLTAPGRLCRFLHRVALNLDCRFGVFDRPCRLKSFRIFGYRRIGVLLERKGMIMNHKKLYRLYREEGLSVTPCKSCGSS